MSQTLMTHETLPVVQQGFRRLTRRVTEAFPEDQLFSHHAPKMRTFGVLALEIMGMVEPTLHGLQMGWETPPRSGLRLLAFTGHRTTSVL